MTEKRYLVTGATSGVGLEVAMSLLAHHATEVVGRSVDKLRALYGHPAIWGARMKQVDFANTEPQLLTDLVKAWAAEPGGAYDGIFHAAGAELVRPLRMTGDDDFRKAMTFADSSFAILRAAACVGVMKPGGSIVIMSSVAAHRGTPGMAAYSAARAAVEAMARAAAIELSARSVRVNCVAAGAFQSALHARVTGRMPEAAREAYAAAHPLGIGPVEAVRDATLHLLGDGGRWTTGTVQVVDGGYLAA